MLTNKISFTIGDRSFEVKVVDNDGRGLCVDIKSRDCEVSVYPELRGLWSYGMIDGFNGKEGQAFLEAQCADENSELNAQMYKLLGVKPKLR